MHWQIIGNDASLATRVNSRVESTATTFLQYHPPIDLRQTQMMLLSGWDFKKVEETNEKIPTAYACNGGFANIEIQDFTE